MSAQAAHTPILTYTNNDDGVWLQCGSPAHPGCGWEVCLDYWPSLDEANQAWDAHRNEVAG
jgi:hypothetical protein